MTDFYSLLRNSIESRDLKTADDRKAVYEQARKALIRTLWAAEQRPAEDEIARRIAAFDAAVERIEGDLDSPDPVAAAAGPARVPAVYEGYDEAADYAAASGAAKMAPALRSDPENEAEAPHPDLEPAALDSEPRHSITRWQEPEPQHDESETAPSHALTVVEDSDPLPSLFRRAERLVEKAKEKLRRDEAGGFEEHDAFDRFDAPTKLAGPPRKRSEREMVRILTGVIAGLAVFLIGFVAYVLYPRSSGPAIAEGGVKQVIVSDAATAAEIPKRGLDVVHSYDVFDGRDPQVFVGSPDNPIHFDRDQEGGFTRVSSSAEASGARAVIGPGLASRLAGQTIRITLVARSSKESGASKLRFAYQSGVAVSHWQVATVSQSYGEIGLIWRVPAQRTANSDALIIEPGIPGDGTGVDIKSIRIDLIKQS